MNDFAALALPEPLLRLLDEVGYAAPSPIQAETIPHLLAGRDLLGQAQTGTGKTAAFALPILARLELGERRPQALVLTPTRELAIQVAEAFERYATHLRGFRALAVYGGAGYGPQLEALRRGVHVVVGTPGRLLDHLGRASLDLSQIRHLVLDEADEMLRMGFLDDVEAIVAATPAARQTALFSATLPAPIRRIAGASMRDPVTVTIAARASAGPQIRQRWWQVAGLHKLDALSRILEVEAVDAAIVFARTKAGTDELAEGLQARGFKAAALNGDVAQVQRERTIAQLRDRSIDVLVATDVAARGLDVDRISHVINYDTPSDPECYVHRIGRTGRAGRSGEAIVFVAPRERRILRDLERATGQAIAPLALPTVKEVNAARIERFKGEVRAALARGEHAVFREILGEMEAAGEASAIELAAAMAGMARGTGSFLLPTPAREEARPAAPAWDEARDEAAGPPAMALYRVEVGHAQGVRPGNLVGAIANEAGLRGAAIGRIEILGEYSLVELPEGLPEGLLRHLGAVWCGGRQLEIARVEGEVGVGAGASARPRGPQGGARRFARPRAGARGVFFKRGS